MWAAVFASIGLVGMLLSTRAIRAYDTDGALVVYTEAMFRIFAFFLMALLVGHLGDVLTRTGLALQVHYIGTVRK